MKLVENPMASEDGHLHANKIVYLKRRKHLAEVDRQFLAYKRELIGAATTPMLPALDDARLFITIENVQKVAGGEGTEW